MVSLMYSIYSPHWASIHIIILVGSRIHIYMLTKHIKLSALFT
jgi:hypothetical protein